MERRKLENAKRELKNTDAHELMAKTVSTHYVSSNNLRYGVIDAIKKIAPKIENDKIKTQAVIENFKKLLIDECKIGPKNEEGFLVAKQVEWLIDNLRSIDLRSKDNPVSEIEAHLLNEIIKSLENELNK